MKFIALSDLPDRTPKGQVFEVHPVMGALLVRIGVAREYVDDGEIALESPKAKRFYRRRDLVADE